MKYDIQIGTCVSNHSNGKGRVSAIAGDVLTVTFEEGSIQSFCMPTVFEKGVLYIEQDDTCDAEITQDTDSCIETTTSNTEDIESFLSFKDWIWEHGNTSEQCRDRLYKVLQKVFEGTRYFIEARQEGTSKSYYIDILPKNFKKQKDDKNTGRPAGIYVKAKGTVDIVLNKPTHFALCNDIGKETKQIKSQYHYKKKDLDFLLKLCERITSLDPSEVLR